MSSMLDKTQVAKRMCPVIFMLDTSGSMSGAPVGAVNSAIENVLPELISMNEDNADNEIKIAVMTFDSDIRWVTGDSELMTPDELKNNWQDLNADGLTSMGSAFLELNNKLSVSHGFMKNASGSVAPVLFLLSDGEPTDDYKYGLNKLQENNWYKVAAKVAIGYGESNDDVLREFTRNVETVLHTDKPENLKKLIRFVTIISSRVASSGGNPVSPDNNSVDPDDNTQQVANALQAQADETW